MARSIQELNEHVKREAAFIKGIIVSTRQVIVGQDALLRRMLIALLSDGHLLIEGVPGLAKTLIVRTLAATIDAQFQRIQFTPDLLPSDLTGTQIYNPQTGAFTARKGPVFTNILLADEINRAPSKVQSALLEAMEERQITIGEESFLLASPYLVLATQNPIEQEGTYPLPEAQLDRFMMKVIVDYPTRDEERTILNRMAGQRPALPEPVTNREAIIHARSVVENIYLDEKIKEYILDIIHATRTPEAYHLKDIGPLIEFGVSPRATLFLAKAGKANAFLNGRGYVTPDDIKQFAPDVLRHRLGISFEAQAEGITAEDIITRILSTIDVP